MSTSELPDKKYLYGRYQKHEDSRNRLGIKTAHKALDIPEDDMNIDVRNGFGWKELLVGGGLAAAVVAVMSYLQKPDTPQKLPPPPPAAASPTDAAYDVRFYDAQGNEVRLDRWQGPPETPAQ